MQEVPTLSHSPTSQGQALGCSVYRAGPDAAVNVIKPQQLSSCHDCAGDSCHPVTTAPCCRLTHGAECRHTHRVGTSGGHSHRHGHVPLNSTVSGCTPRSVSPPALSSVPISTERTEGVVERYRTARHGTARRSPQLTPTARSQQPATSAGKNCARQT